MIPLMAEVVHQLRFVVFSLGLFHPEKVLVLTIQPLAIHSIECLCI